MDDVGRYILIICFMLLFTAVTAILSANQVAVFTMSESSIKRLVDSQKKYATNIAKARENAFGFYIQITASIIICLILTCWLGVCTFEPFVLDIASNFIKSPSVATVVANLAVLLIVGFVFIVFGVALPKKTATVSPEKVAFSTHAALRFFLLIFRPLTIIPLLTARLFSKFLSLDTTKTVSDITEEEIRLMVDAGNENGEIELCEKEMINNVFEFDDRTVDEVMTHRTEVVGVEKNDKISDVIYHAINEGFSRIPVYDNDIDNIIGIMYVKDLLALVGCKTSEDFVINDFIRPILYVPESARCRMLFKEFKEKKTHMAVVVDDYGGTAGIVTMEDLLESIVGDIQDEYDCEDEEIKAIDENNFSLDGSISTEKVNKLFNLDLDSDDGETLGGIIANTIDRIPQEGECPTIIIENVEFSVTLVEDRRIARVNARLLQPQKTQE
ncbi:MAG: hemolysin family protein [Oscillospiraceae bacterium]